MYITKESPPQAVMGGLSEHGLLGGTSTSENSLNSAWFQYRAQYIARRFRLSESLAGVIAELALQGRARR
jgi:hypothetical protein